MSRRAFVGKRIFKIFHTRKGYLFGNKRRRWRCKILKNEIVRRDVTLVADGTKLTQELSDFLKLPDKYERRFDK